ncbi:MAG TPA: hypothetical protein PLK58_03130 [Candidatus Rifleibacterium sp.]|nr:hypothetical protein [Candidatus Rifleibacterium sp.]
MQKKFTGRYIEINVKTLSFAEYLVFKQFRDGNEKAESNLFHQIHDFIRLGGFPAIHVAGYGFEDAGRIVSDIYASALLRDTIQRYRIRNIELLERIVRFIFDNIGNCFSANKVADYFKSQHRRIDLNTVYNYLAALESSFIVKRVQRYDLKGREIPKPTRNTILPISRLNMLYLATKIETSQESWKTLSFTNWSVAATAYSLANSTIRK